LTLKKDVYTFHIPKAIKYFVIKGKNNNISMLFPRAIKNPKIFSLCLERVILSKQSETTNCRFGCERKY